MGYLAEAAPIIGYMKRKMDTRESSGVLPEQ
jgi:hypothetical protein